MSGLKVGVMGAGSVGCYVGGRLLQSADVEVVLVGRGWLADELGTHGLTTTPLGGAPQTVAPERVTVVTDPAALAAVDLVLVCVKSAATDGVGEALAGILPPDGLVVSLQNGVQNAPTLRARLGDRAVLAGVVGFNVVSKGEGRFLHTTKGELLLEDHADPRARRLFAALRAGGLGLAVHRDLAPHQWTKLLVNLNNAVSALSGAPTAQLLLNPGYREVVRALMAEGLAVTRAAGKPLARLRGIPVGSLVWALGLPSVFVRLLARAQLSADPEARSSMWEDLTRGRKTEVDYLNGEVVRVAGQAGVAAPLNARTVACVHEVEEAMAGCPGWSPAELQRQLGL